MDVFSYLSVYVSLILALAVSRNLIGLATLIEQRARVTWSWPFLAWSCLFVILGALEWWSMLDWRGFTSYYVLEFFLMLVKPTLFFLMCALLFPRFPESGPIDLGQHYERVRPWVFSIGAGYALMYLAVSAVQTRKHGAAFFGETMTPSDWVLTFVTATVLTLAAATRSSRYHAVLPPLVLVLIVAMFL